ncbi:MAG: hypothetical protein ACKOQ4_07155 [Mycobacterium sp.]
MSQHSAAHPAAAAAFGADPGRWPIPAAREPNDLWLYAVAAGGQGRYAAANAALTELLRGAPGARLASLALSTRASFLRQLGWHWRAHDVDGRAWARAGGDSEAGGDALIGLAADALGVGRLPASATLLRRADELFRQAGGVPARQQIRLAWVRAELAMAAGDGATATTHARRGVERAEAALPALRRHRVKSDVVLAAALSCAGDLAGARAVADSALASAQSLGLAPLAWASACLLAGIGSGERGPAAIAELRDRNAGFVTRHGGRWKTGDGR